MNTLDKADLNSCHTPNIIQSLSGFTLILLEFTLSPLEKINLGPDEIKGDRWRGGFGKALRNLACFYRWEETECTQCNLTSDCFYFLYFATNRPHPYIMRPELDSKSVYNSGEDLSLEIILIGEATGHADKFIKTIDELGRTGIGTRRGRFRIKDIEIRKPVSFREFFPLEVQSMEKLAIEFLSPLKIKEGANGLNYRNLSFETFFRLLIKRLINLNNLYCNGRAFDKERIEPEKQDLFSLAREIEAKTYTEWRDFKRFSSRQHKSLKIGGQLGIIVYNGDTGPFYPYLKLGEIVGVGQHTTSGFGRYRLIAA